MELPDSMPNSEVKRSNADGSVGFPHVRVGHRRVLLCRAPQSETVGVFFYGERGEGERIEVGKYCC